MEPAVVAAPAGAVLKAAVAGLVGLGALHSRAGATELVTNEPSPLRSTVGVAVSTAAVSLSGTQTQPSSWNVTGSLPPGLSINDRATLGTFAAPVLVLTGTPTAAGTFQLGISGSDAGYTSPSLPYTITVVAAGTPAKRTTNSPNVRTCSRLTMLSASTNPNSCRAHTVDAGNSLMERRSDTAKDSTCEFLNYLDI
jgi:hypothetical protein